MELAIQIIIAVAAIFTAWLKWEEHKRNKEVHEARRRQGDLYSYNYRDDPPLPFTLRPNSRSYDFGNGIKLVLFWIIWGSISFFVFGFVWFFVLFIILGITTNMNVSDSVFGIVMVLAAILTLASSILSGDLLLKKIEKRN